MKHKIVRKQEAEARNTAYEKLSVQDKLAHLDARLGAGIGAKKQRARLQEEIEAKQKEGKKE